MHEYFQDIADFIVPSVINWHSLGNSKNLNLCLRIRIYFLTQHS